MTPGALDQRVSLERLEQGQDEIGPPVTAWVTHDGRVYDVQSVIDYQSAKREIVLMCRG